MLALLLALLPALLAQSLAFGPAVLRQVLLASVVAIAIEAAVLGARDIRPGAALADGSALVTAWLLALALPPGLPAALLVLGVAFALLLGKHAYGGLGYNLFNPAMVGYAALLLSFPAELAQWPTPAGAVDAVTAATPLDAARHGLAGVAGSAADAAPAESTWFWEPWPVDPWPLINLAYLGGGLLLVILRVADATIALSVLLGLGLTAMLLDGMASAGFHLLHGASMALAFFIATDPVSAPAGRAARALYGLLIGALALLIRERAGYPDGAAFAVLLGNAMAPLMERLALGLRRWRS